MEPHIKFLETNDQDDEDEEEYEEENEPDIYTQEFVTAPDRKQFFRPFSGSHPTSILGPKNFNPQDNKRWLIHKMYVNLFNYNKETANLLSEFAQNLNLEHKNTFALALAISICYDLLLMRNEVNQPFTINPELIKQLFLNYDYVFNKEINSNKSATVKINGKSTFIENIKEKYYISVFNYINYVINNTDNFKFLKPLDFQSLN